MYKLTDLYNQIKNENLNITKYNIFCDMDGVLCDFDFRFEQYGNISPKAYEIKHGAENFWNLINKIGYEFWSKMPWMKDGKQLWDYIKTYNPKLLSAPSKHSSSRYGKRLWVKENLGNYQLILSDRNKKQNYSKKNRILIDDRDDTIIEWNSRGGIGILHTSASDTIKQLKNLGL